MRSTWTARCPPSSPCEAQIPDDALTAKTLGTERIGNGAVIGPNGLVLTIGYLITEAVDVALTLNDGRRVAAHGLGADPVTGFGLVQALEPLGLPAAAAGRLAHAFGRRSGDHRRRRRPRPCRGGPCPHPDALRRLLGVSAGRRDHDRAGASALERRRPDRATGELLGVGSLSLQRQSRQGVTSLNMFVPTELLAADP